MVIKLNKPELCNNKIYKEIYESLNSENKLILKQIEDKRDIYIKELMKKIESDSLFDFSKQEFTSTEQKKLIYLYDKLSSKNNLLYAEYKKILDIVEVNGSRCPYCNDRIADELDHYLPKSIFPYYSIVSENLVPICHQCNKRKGNYYGETSSDRIIHPYFDNINSEWLTMSYSHDTSFSFKMKDEYLDNEMYKSLDKTLNKLGIYEHFVLKVIGEWQEIISGIERYQSQEEGIKASIELIKLENEFTSTSSISWKKVFYKFLLNQENLEQFILESYQ